MTADLQRAWLAGFVDGEGSIHFCVDKKSQIIEPVVTVVNTDRRNAEEVKKILASIVGREVRFRLLNSSKGYRPLYSFAVSKHSDIVTLLESLLPFLVGKKPQAMLMLDYMKVAPGKGGRFQAFHYDFVSTMKNMNRRYKPGEWDTSQRETERLAPKEGEETVRPAWQHAEGNRNVYPLVNLE